MPSASNAEWTIVSAPGKVLITGGYLVLDRAYEGTSVATDSRFFSCARTAGHATADGLSERPHNLLGRVTVVSPQFDGVQWAYDVVDKGAGALVGLEARSGSNPYLANALLFSLSLALTTEPHIFKEKLAAGLTVAVLGDNDFYSQASNLEARGLPRTAEGLGQLEPFMPLGPLSGVRKTGLGSSAALVTSLVFTILSFFGVISLSSEDADLARRGRQIGHATAQLAHCLAQGKVGSGFDVASAVFGSGVYRRFDPEIVARAIKLHEASKLTLNDLAELLAPKPGADPWNYSHTAVSLPRGLVLMLADISAGSETPGMVSKVLKWRADNPDQAGVLWTDIDRANMKLFALFRRLEELASADPDGYAADLARASAQPAKDMKSTSETTAALRALHETCLGLRSNLRLMSDLAAVPIEPPEQTSLLDETMACPGVLVAAVPGAGGMDAIYAIVVGEEVAREVQKAWEKRGGVCGLLSRAGIAGARIERAADVKGLKAVLDKV